MTSHIDEYESTNAREWDEPITKQKTTAPKTVADKCTSTATTILPNGTSRMAGTEGSTVSNLPTRKIIKQQDEDLGVFPRHLRPSHRRSHHLEERFEGSFQKSHLSKEWARVNLVTSRKQAEIDVEIKKRHHENEFMRQAPCSEELPAKAFYLWSDDSITPYELLGENLNNLDDIRRYYEVYIDFDATCGCVRFRSKNTKNITNALRQVKQAIQNAKADASAFTPLFVVDPPTPEVMTSRVRPHFRTTEDPTQRPIIVKVSLAGSKLSAKDTTQWFEERSGYVRASRAQLLQHLKFAFCNLNELQSGMRMRVHLGHVELLLYRKDFKDLSYSVQNFMKMMSETRTKAQLEKSIGNAYLALQIKSRIHLFPDLFYPADSIAKELADIKPKHTLILLALTPSGDKVRIEAELDEVLGPKTSWQLGTTAYYRHGGRKTRVTAGALSLQSNFDWCLEITTNDVILKNPKELQCLTYTDLQGKPGERRDEFGLSYPSVSPRLPQSIGVQNTWIRSVEQYRLAGTPYILETAVYRRWNGTITTGEPASDCGVSLYNKEWDILMVQQDAVGDRGWGAGLECFFPEKNEFFGFLDVIQGVQSFLSNVNQACR